MGPEMAAAPAKLAALGQSLWLDSIERTALENGEIQALIDRGEIRGVTSNPSIFDHAISSSGAYREAIRALAWSGSDAETIYWQLVTEDVRSALDLFQPLYEQSNGSDGLVSIEVSPRVANDTEATLAQAQQLWARLGRPNLMIKIPATEAGLPAIRRSIAAGLNINITLIFSRLRYAAVMEAYISGLEDRLASGRSLEHIASVASIFVSRVDAKIDVRLPKGSPLRGRAAIANAKLAYQDFRRTFSGDRWQRLVRAGARLQRPLWASTSPKDPAFPDTLYVDELIGPDTVNTITVSTLEAMKRRAHIDLTLRRGVEDAGRTLQQLEHHGITLEAITDELQHEGVMALAKAMDETLAGLELGGKAALREAGDLGVALADRIELLAAENYLERLHAGDPALWSQSAEGQAEAGRRLGWLDAPQKGMLRRSAWEQLARDALAAGITHVLVLGMGGSSLATEVISAAFGGDRVGGALRLGILDSTDPVQVAQAAHDFPPASCLYIVSSKSGGTAEVLSALEYFWALSGGDGSHFVAISDAGTPLQSLSKERGFRQAFAADSSVGGRYSALTDFGMLPAALLGVDLVRFLDCAGWMQRQNARDMPTGRGPGVALGALLGEASLRGREKLTLLADPEIETLPNWIEQLVAESSGKDGRGIIPVAFEPADSPDVYGSDRLFVYLRQKGQLDGAANALLHAGFPVVTLDVPDSYAVAAEFFRWEVAVATACHVIGVNPFDQPDVQESKDRTQAKIELLRSQGRLDEGRWDVDLSTADGRMQWDTPLRSLLQRAQPGDYVAINAYLPRRADVISELQRLRVQIRERTHLATTVGFGPRFQHSTGQLHKGGPNTGLFIQIVSEQELELPIPGSSLTFGSLIRAQALGDYETLVARHRRVVRVRLARPADVSLLRRSFDEPVE